MNHLPKFSGVLLLAFVAVLLMRGQSETTALLIASSVLMFGACWASAIHLLGARAALHFVLIAVTLGWFAEQMGSTHGWFFGSYRYTDVLGPRLGDVPAVIPLMWFALTYVGYVLANLIVWQAPSDGVAGTGWTVVMALLAAMLVTAYDLGADPYFVFQLKAWIMAETDGDWFGETVQGFAGWMFVSFVIIAAFRLTLRRHAPAPTLALRRRDVLVPIGIYAFSMVFQAATGKPVETRTVAVFAMGIPLLAALCGLARWRAPAAASSTSGNTSR